MKTRIILSLLIISAVIYSCKKDNTQTTDTNFFITAQKSNNAWTGTPFAGILGDTLYISGGTSVESLNMKIKFANTGKYTITGNQCIYTVNHGGVAIAVQYALRTDTINSVSITSYDADKQIFEGTFDVSLVQSAPVLVNPAKINFIKGKFRIRRGGFAQ